MFCFNLIITKKNIVSIFQKATKLMTCLNNISWKSFLKYNKHTEKVTDICNSLGAQRHAPFIMRSLQTSMDTYSLHNFLKYSNISGVGSSFWKNWWPKGTELNFESSISCSWHFSHVRIVRNRVSC